MSGGKCTTSLSEETGVPTLAVEYVGLTVTMMTEDTATSGKDASFVFELVGNAVTGEMDSTMG